MTDENIKSYMFQFIKDICEDIGPRESGTEAEILAGNKIEEELKKFCDNTHQEEYISSPHAFLGGIRYGAMLVFVAIIFYWITLLADMNLIILDAILYTSFLIIAIVLIIVTVSYFILEVMKYYEIFDFLFPKRESKNIIGTINPKNDIQKTIIFSAHHDSAFEFNTFYYLKRFGQIIINVGYLGVVIVFIGIILKLIFYLTSIQSIMLFFILGIIFFCFTPIILVYIFFHSYHPVLGAFDNLSAVAVILGIGKYLHENKINSENYPNHTKIHLISFAGEEAGLRGSKRYIKAHLKELLDNNTIIINLESIAKKDTIVIIDKESGIGAKHDPMIYEPLLKIAKEVNSKAKLGTLPFGATDAATFSKLKIPATTLAGLNLKEELAPYYHTRNDIPEVIEEDALGQIVEICVKYVKLIDQ